MSRPLRGLRAAALLAGCALAAGCAAPESAAPTVTAADFAAFEQALLREGGLRTERAPADAPVADSVLVENFRRVAFGLEPDANRGRGSHMLHRREGPVRWWVHASGPDAAAARADVARAFVVMARATGLDIARAGRVEAADFHVMFLRAGDYPAAARWARRALGRHEAGLIGDFRTRPVLCTGSVRVGESGAHESALVLIRAGYSDLLRRGCVEEEIAQALGLANDDPRVRPSVFNDDEEFALLTVHDELLLRILYDPRLEAGMTAAEAMPLVATIVRGLRWGR